MALTFTRDSGSDLSIALGSNGIEGTVASYDGKAVIPNGTAGFFTLSGSTLTAVNPVSTTPYYNMATDGVRAYYQHFHVTNNAVTVSSFDWDSTPGDGRAEFPTYNYGPMYRWKNTIFFWNSVQKAFRAWSRPHEGSTSWGRDSAKDMELTGYSPAMQVGKNVFMWPATGDPVKVDLSTQSVDTSETIPLADHVLTRSTDQFILGEKLYVLGGSAGSWTLNAYTVSGLNSVTISDLDSAMTVTGYGGTDTDAFTTNRAPAMIAGIAHNVNGPQGVVTGSGTAWTLTVTGREITNAPVYVVADSALGVETRKKVNITSNAPPGPTITGLPGSIGLILPTAKTYGFTTSSPSDTFQVLTSDAAVATGMVRDASAFNRLKAGDTGGNPNYLVVIEGSETYAIGATT